MERLPRRTPYFDTEQLNAAVLQINAIFQQTFGLLWIAKAFTLVKRVVMVTGDHYLVLDLGERCHEIVKFFDFFQLAVHGEIACMNQYVSFDVIERLTNERLLAVSVRDANDSYLR